MTAVTMATRFGSGREVKRIEDEGLLRGLGRYADDVAPQGLLHLKFLRSPHAHARIVGIAAEAAKAAPGVVAVMTGAELAAAGVLPIPIPPMFQRPDGSPGATPLRTALAVEFVRFVGEAVALVVAETADQAKDAAELIEVDYEPLPAVADPVSATAEGAPVVFAAAPDNIAARMSYGDRAICDAAFAGAAHVVSIDIVNQRLVAAPMETRACMAEPTDNRMTVRMSTQGRPPRVIRSPRRSAWTRQLFGSSPRTSAAASASSSAFIPRTSPSFTRPRRSAARCAGPPSAQKISSPPITAATS